MKIGFDIFPGGYFRADPSQFDIDPALIMQLMIKHNTENAAQAMIEEIGIESRSSGLLNHPMLTAMERAAIALQSVRPAGCA